MSDSPAGRQSPVGPTPLSAAPAIHSAANINIAMDPERDSSIPTVHSNPSHTNINVAMDPERGLVLPILHSNPVQTNQPTSTPAPAHDQAPTSPPIVNPRQPRPPSSLEKFDEDGFSAEGSSHPHNGNRGLRPVSRGGAVRRRTADTRSGIDWIVPVDEKKDLPLRPHSVGERLQPTLNTAREERAKYALKAKMTGYALNAAIGMQVLLGSLVTGLAAVTSGHRTSIMTSILGGLSTIVASYLARARGSNEPELSITRVKDLEQFIRECEAFQLDWGHTTGPEYDAQLNGFRQRFEELLGNANGERKLSPPV